MNKKDFEKMTPEKFREAMIKLNASLPDQEYEIAPSSIIDYTFISNISYADNREIRDDVISIQDIRTLLTHFKDNEDWDKYVLIFRRKTESPVFLITWSYSSSIYSTFDITIDVLFDKHVYIFMGFYKLLQNISLEELANCGISDDCLTKLIARRRCRMTDADYETAKRLVVQGKVPFAHLFGRDRFTVKSSDDLYEMMQCKDFFARTTLINAEACLITNVHVLFTCYTNLFDERICNYLISKIDYDVDDMDPRSVSSIIGRFKYFVDFDEDFKRRIPESVLLMVETLG